MASKREAKARDTTDRQREDPAEEPTAGGLESLSEAIESGEALPAVARAAAAALGASVALIDRSSTVLAVAARSSSEESKLLAGEEGVSSVGLRVADSPVGELRLRPRSGADPAPGAIRMVTTLLALAVERARSPEWASDEAARDFVAAVLDRRIADPADVAARAAELGAELTDGAGVLLARAHPHAAQEGEWRARMLTLALRAVRSGGGGALGALSEESDAREAGEVRAIVPAADPERITRAAGELHRELASALTGFTVVVGYSRHVPGAAEVFRAGKEALLAANVAEAEGMPTLAFEETGSYRLLLSAMSEDPAELERFYEETVAPLAAYDEQYETELVTTVEAYLANDGNVTPTAETLFTHRHTIRYRLERVKELSGHDLSSTEGREKIGLGLKAMRVLGIRPPRGPAMEGPGGRAGKIKRGES
jgi:sugar diacid utilization regulator